MRNELTPRERQALTRRSITPWRFWPTKRAPVSNHPRGLDAADGLRDGFWRGLRATRDGRYTVSDAGTLQPYRYRGDRRPSAEAEVPFVTYRYHVYHMYPPLVTVPSVGPAGVSP